VGRAGIDSIMRVLVTGGRFWRNKDVIFSFLDKIHELLTITTVIHGDCRGADRLCRDWAIENNIDVEPYPADWDQYGKKAGIIRNQLMLDQSNPDILVAFRGSTGTAHMKSIAKKAGLEIIECDTN